MYLQTKILATEVHLIKRSGFQVCCFSVNMYEYSSCLFKGSGGTSVATDAFQFEGIFLLCRFIGRVKQCSFTRFQR